MLPYPLTSEALVDDVIADLDRVTDAVRERFGPLTDDALAWRPAPKRWGVGHCLVHLARVNELYREALTPALREGHGSGLHASGPLRGRWFGRVFTGLQERGGLKVRTPALSQPRDRLAAEGSIETFLAEQHRLRSLVGQARGLDLDAIRVASPFTSLVKLAAGDAFRVLAAHERRHLAQAERVLVEPRFPG